MDLPSAPSRRPVPPSGVLERALLLLSLFTLERNRLFLREAAELSGLDKSTCLRALRVLTRWGFLERHPEGSYSPGPANMRLAAIFKASSNLLNRLDEPLNQISRRAGQTAAFFVRSENQRLCLARSRLNDNHTRFVEVGVPVALADGGSAARVLLAYTGPDPVTYREVRRLGYATSRGERLAHYASASIPLFEADGTFLGAITVSGLSVAISDDDLRCFADTAKTEMSVAGFQTEPPKPAR